MKTTIFLPDDLAARFEEVAAENDLNRSEFFQRAGVRYADQLQLEGRVAAINAAIDAVGQPDSSWTGVAARRLIDGGHWEW